MTHGCGGMIYGFDGGLVLISIVTVLGVWFMYMVTQWCKEVTVDGGACL